MRDLGQSGVYTEVNEYETIDVKPLPSLEIQQRPLPPPALPVVAPQECSKTSLPTSMPTSIQGNENVDVYTDVGQKSNEGEYSTIIEVGQNQNCLF